MLPARTLTFQFERAVTHDGITPVELEVRVHPLGDRLNGTVPDAALVGQGATQYVVLSQASNPVSFQLVPSDSPGLQGQTLWYRVGIKNRWMGKVEITDFTMPDADLTFAQLKDLGAVIGTDVYLRQVDVGVHIAGLDDDGNVLDGHGNIVGVDTSGLTAAINAERLQRQQSIAATQTQLQNETADQVAQTLLTATARINAAVSELESADLAERGQRIAAVNTLNASLASIQQTINGQLAAIGNQVAANTAALPNKADLINGTIPTSQMPSISLITAIPVISQAAMLALTTNQVQPGDIAVRPDGSYLLLQNPPSTLANWIKISTGGNVISVNGQVGPVVLGAADVGAIAIGAMLDQDQITGLVAALAAKASTATVNGINSRLSTVENDATIVRSVSGLIAKSLMPVDTVFVNGSNQLVKKDGTTISIGGGGGPVDWNNLFNVPSTFRPTIGTTADTAVAGNDARLTNARTPTSHASTHGAAGADPVSVTVGQVSGLQSTLTSYGNRINTLEAGSGGPGGGSGPPVKAAWFDGSAVADVANPAQFQTELVLQKSPFGQAGDGTYYYDPAGAANDEWRYPYITPNGHLKLVKWDETAPADPAYATASSVIELTEEVALKANASDLSALNTTVGTKADKTYVDNADNMLLSALNTGLAAKAAQADFQTLQTTVAGKAAQADLQALTTTVNGKAAAADVTNLTTRVTTAEGQIVNKADLVSGRVPNNQLRDDIPASKISGLPAQLTSKADLDGNGKVLLTQIPQNIPLDYVVNLPSTLAGKADLVGGKLATSQLPALAVNDIYPVANRAGMLALTTAQVQPGDIALITGTADKGSYFYTGNDPSVFSSWTKSPVPDDVVSSVNGQIGPVVLAAADVNARSASDPIGANDLSAALTSTIAGKADTTAVNAALANKPSLTDVQALMSQASAPQPVDVVATTNLTLTGTPSIDGVVTTVGMRVLATAQSSSINNGVYVVSGSGSWARAFDMAGPTASNPGVASTFFLRGTTVIVAQGTNHANSVWVQSATSGQVGSAANNWVKALTAGPPLVYTAAANSGLSITGTAIVAKNTTGISVTNAGIGVDHNRVPWVYRGDVPGGSGSTSVAITHNLGVQAVASVVLIDKVSNVSSYIGWTNTSANVLTLDFQTPPSSGQYSVVVTA